jgi:peptide/nickel transport system substrate-binding protein
MRKLLWIMAAVSVLVMIAVGCGGAAPTSVPAPTSAPVVITSAPVVVKETVVVQGTPQVVERVVTATPPPTAAPITSPKPGGTLTVGMLADFQGFDPFNLSWFNWTARSNLYDSILRYRHNLTPQPGLAETWELSSDGLQVTLHLRHGVKFHNGRELVADDILKNIKRAQDPKTCTHMCTDAQKISAAEAPDQYTVVLHYAKINTAWADFMEDFFIIAPEAFDHVKDAPIGTGPFMFKDYVPNDHATFVKNPNYWGKNGPYLDQIVLKPFGGDEKAEVSALETGAVDLLQDTPFSEETLLKVKAYQIFTGEPGGLVDCLYINPLKFPDKRVRQAIALSLDRKSAIDAMYFGDGEVYWGPYPKESWAYDKALENAVPYDLNKAKSLLQAAGASNLTFTFQALNTAQVNLASVMQASLKSIGVTMNVQLLDSTQWVDLFVATKFDVITSLISGSNKDPAKFYGDNFYFKPYPSSKLIAPDKFNPKHPTTGETYSDLVDQGGSVLDQTKRQEIYNKIQELLVDQSWTSCWTKVSAPFAAAPYVKGFDWRMDDGLLFEGVWLAK